MSTFVSASLAMMLLLSSVLPYQPLLATDDPKNHPPIARAGPNQTVEEGSLVMLDGSTSRDRDSDSLAFGWVQLKGKSVVLSDPTSESPTFTAPNVKEEISLLFELTVSDGSKKSTDSVRITVVASEVFENEIDEQNHPPLANAGEDIVVDHDQSQVILNGSLSSDPDGDELSFSWAQIDGPRAELENGGSMIARFSVLDNHGVTMKFELSVSDGSENGTGVDAIEVAIPARQTAIEERSDDTSSDNETTHDLGHPATQPKLTLTPNDVDGTAEIHGTAYLDTDSDGLRATSEPGLENVWIRLFGSGDIEPLVDLPMDPGPFVVHSQAGKIYMVPPRKSFPTPESVRIIDGEGQEPVKTISIGRTVKSTITINPSTDLVYVANERANRLIVINAADDTVVDRVRIKRPISVEVDSESNLIYVLSKPDSLESSVIVLDGANNEIVQTIPLGSDVSGMALDKSTDILYFVENSGSESKVARYHIESGVTEEVVVDGILAQGIQANPETHLVYAIVTNATDVNKRYLVIINGGTQLGINARVQIDVASDLDIDPSSNLVFLVGEAGLSVVDGSSATKIATISAPERSSFIHFDPDSRLVYVASSGNPQDDHGPTLGSLGGTVVKRAETAQDGSFSFIGLAEGRYTLTEMVPESFNLSQPVSEFYSIELAEKQVLTERDFGNAPEDSLGKLTVRAADASGTPLAGIPIQVFSGSTEIASGNTLASFNLFPGEYTVVANNIDSTFFSEWSDGVRTSSRDVTIVSGSELELGALYAIINSTSPVTVKVIATLQDGTPLDSIVSTIIYADNNTNVLDHGISPKDYHLAEGDQYHVFAIDSDNYTFSHWFDPLKSNDTSRELTFEAKEGRVLNSVYRESTFVTIPITSKLTNGTVIENMFNKIERISNKDGQNSLLDSGFTPNVYQIEKDSAAYVVSAGDFEGYVIDHWEATGGPHAKKIVFSDKYSFSPEFPDNAVDSLTAVYRIVSDDKFASVPVENQTVRIEDINDGITIEFTEVQPIENITAAVTAAETDVISDFDLFDSVTVIQGEPSSAIATLNATRPERNNDEARYETQGPVLRINDAYLTTEGEKEVTVHYDPSKITSPRLLHFNGEIWEDVTIEVDNVTQTVTGRLKTLSHLLVGEGGAEHREDGYNTPVEPGDKILTPSVGISGDMSLMFGNITSTGILNVRSKLLNDNDVIAELIENNYIDPDSKFGIGGVKILVDNDINYAVGSIFDITTHFDYLGDIEVTIPYDTDLLSDDMSESEIIFLHYTSSRWEEVPATVTEGKNTVTARLDSLSPVAAAIPPPSETPPSDTPTSGSGGGSSQPVTPVQPEAPESPTSSSEYLEQGLGVIGAVALDVDGMDHVVEFRLEQIISPGNITVTLMNSSELPDLLDSAPMRTVTLTGTNLTMIESAYNVSSGRSLITSGAVDISVPYNVTLITSMQNVTEADVRLLYNNGTSWIDSTVRLNATANTVAGRLDSFASPVFITAAIARDGTFGAKYFEVNRLAKVSLDSVELLVDDSLCQETESGQRDCPVELTGEIRNAQRINQTYVIIVQTTDELGIVQGIESIEGSLDKAQKMKLNMSWNVGYSDSPSRYRVKLFVLDSLDAGVNVIAESRELNLDLG